MYDLLAALALIATGPNPAPAPAVSPVSCVMETTPGQFAPCPPPIVSTNGDQIGGGANSEPINMGDLPRTGPDYTYEPPTFFDDDTDEEEPTEEPSEEPTDGEEPAPAA
ncbi:hypothetical protein SEA_LILBEANIE_11 [Gordonia phage Lilbeanie]|uniref:Uncharacterized protein n=1 Tax=Gordonia phage Lilbeanie TaxID=2794947 RepID=A0A7T1KS79_9CAUD|nr:hypothetical protein J1773_gp11 [Gordonia phage Lilbeanie]QPO17089.1 hypothetical protein SEA_LILBEANIE_11 [Gordonia phage Lilbeanie]